MNEISENVSNCTVVYFQQKRCEVTASRFKPVILSTSQTLPEFVKAHANTFPVTALVTSGYQSDDGDVEISCNEVLCIHSLHITPVILAMHENRPIPPIPLTTETPFSVIYNPNNDRKEAMQGFVFGDVSSLLSIAHPPKVVCVTKEWTGDSTTISKGEILVIKKQIVHGPHVAAGIVAFSISKMVEKFLPEECAGQFNTDPSLIAMSLENIFAYISNPFEMEVYTRKFLKQCNNGFLYLIGRDVIQYLVYSSKGGEIASGHLPVHVPDVKLCLIMDSTLPKTRRFRDMKQDALNDDENMNHQSPTQPPLLHSKNVLRTCSLTMPMEDPSAMITLHSAIQPAMDNQPPPLPPEHKCKLHYPSDAPNIVKTTCSTKQVNVASYCGVQECRDFRVSTTCDVMKRPITSKQFHSPHGSGEIFVEHPLCAHDAILPESSANFNHSCPHVRKDVQRDISDGEAEPVVEPGTDHQWQGPQTSPVHIVARDDIALASSSGRQSHNCKVKSQTFRHLPSPNLTSILSSPTNIGGHLQPALIPKTGAFNARMHNSLMQTSAPQTTTHDGTKTLQTSASIGNIMVMQEMYDEPMSCPMFDVCPTLPPPYIPDVEMSALKLQGESLKYPQGGGMNAQPSMIEGYCQASKPLTLNQFASQYSDQLPVSIHVTAAADLISGPKYLNVTALKVKEVVIAEDYTGKQIEILLMSPKRFSILYGQTNIEDIKGTLQGQTIYGVSDFLKLKDAPMVVCATKTWKTSVMSVDENEILILQSIQREGAKNGIVVFSVHTRSMKFLPRRCTAHFSTNAALLGLPMIDLIGYVPKLFPCNVCSVVYGKEPKCYPVDVITLKEVVTTTALECVPMHKDLYSTYGSSLLSIPVGLSTVEVVVLEKLRDSNAGLTEENNYVTIYSVS